jgi:hypothetical protein
MELQIIETPEYYLAISDDDVGVNIPFWGYCWNWYKKVNFFENGLNKDARGRGGIQKIIAYQPKGNALELLHIVKLPSDENVNIQKISSLPLLPEMVIEDDLREAFEAGWKKGRFGNYPKGHKEYQPDFTEFIQSLKQPTSKWFIAEMETYDEGGFSPERKLKTTTINGKTYLVGNYKFE